MSKSLGDYCRALLSWILARPAAPCAAVQAPTAKDERMPRGPDLAHAQQLLDRVTELTAGVAADVGQHNVSIQNLNKELAATDVKDVQLVADVVCKLLLVNQQLQERLERAELKLQAHSRQLQDAVSAARTDALTGLMNRRALDEELQRALRDLRDRGRPCALMLLDVDRFKQFNDTYGHVAGDEVLVYLADTLRAHARDSDVVARFGGEEFAVLFLATSAEAVCQRANELRRQIGEGKITIEGQVLRVTASGGVAGALPGEDAAAWIKRADAALYAAKNNGRNCGYWNTGETIEPIPAQVVEPVHEAEVPDAASAPHLAVEAFSDTTFVREVSRQIAEWRRGGSTFSVALVRRCCDENPGWVEPEKIQQAGNRALLQVGRQCVRDMDLVTRWLSDGLAILLPAATASDARRVSRRILDALSRIERSVDELPEMTVCIGIAEGIEGNDANRVLQRAWMALEAAREAGKGTMFIHDGIRTVSATPRPLSR